MVGNSGLVDGNGAKQGACLGTHRRTGHIPTAAGVCSQVPAFAPVPGNRRFLPLVSDATPCTGHPPIIAEPAISQGSRKTGQPVCFCLILLTTQLTVRTDADPLGIPAREDRGPLLASRGTYETRIQFSA
jgi:hypothetical protein